MKVLRVKNKSFSDIDSDAELGNSLIITGGSGLGLYGGVKYHNYKDKKDLDKLFEEVKMKTDDKTTRINEEYKKEVEKFKKNKEKIRFRSARDLKLYPNKNPLIDHLNYEVFIDDKDKKGMLGNDQSRAKSEKEVLSRFKKIKNKKISDAIMEGAEEFSRASKNLKAGSTNRLLKRITKGSLIGSALSVPAMIAYESTKDPKVIKKKYDNNKLLDSAPGVGAMIGLGYSSYKSDPISEIAEEMDIMNEPKKSKRILKRIKQAKRYFGPAVIGAAIGYGIKKSNDSFQDRKETIKIRDRIKQSEAKLKELEKDKKKV